MGEKNGLIGKWKWLNETSDVKRIVRLTFVSRSKEKRAVEKKKKVRGEGGKG